VTSEGKEGAYESGEIKRAFSKSIIGDASRKKMEKKLILVVYHG
jgi:hypothetical protein